MRAHRFVKTPVLVLLVVGASVLAVVAYHLVFPAGTAPAAETGPDAVQLWELVATGTELEARQAAEELAFRSPVPEGPAFLQAKLGDENPRVRIAAVSLIRERHLTDYVPDLICRLSDVDRKVRFAALSSLEELTGESFGPMEYNTPIEKREQLILRWHDYWARTGDQEDGMAELLGLYSSTGSLEFGPVLLEHIFGLGQELALARAEHSGSVPSHLLPVAVSVIGSESEGRALQIAVGESSADDVFAGALTAEVVFLDAGGNELDAASAPLPAGTDASGERGVQVSLPADAEEVRYSVKGTAEDGSQQELAAGRAQLQRPAELPFAR